MIYQAPAGARDLLPLEVAQKSWINDRLQEVFQRWGYKRIVTSTIEWVDTLLAGGAIQPEMIIQLENAGEGRLGLRPELTASIARAAVNRLKDHSIQRLCYRANVFRNPPIGHHGKQLEFYQAGVELLFVDGLLADAEILLLLKDCLEYLGVTGWQLLLGDAGLTNSLLAIFPLPHRLQIRRCLASLDRVTLERLDLEEHLKQKALQLFELRGNPIEVLSRLSKWELDNSAAKAVNHLESLMELLYHTTDNSFPIVLDLSLVKSFDYYTGIVFVVVKVIDNKPYVLGQGGRYDQLLALYHPQKKPSPGIGFCFNIEDLHHCLRDNPNLPKTIPPSDWLVIPTSFQASKQAFAYAQTLRRAPHIVRVELELKMRTPEEIRQYAKQEGISYLAWVDENSRVKVEMLQS